LRGVDWQLCGQLVEKDEKFSLVVFQKEEDLFQTFRRRRRRRRRKKTKRFA
jgi:hypothetical protein